MITISLADWEKSGSMMLERYRDLDTVFLTDAITPETTPEERAKLIDSLRQRWPMVKTWLF